jgi:hypothetical protein
MNGLRTFMRNVGGDIDSGHAVKQLLLGWHGGRRREEEVQPAVRGDERRVLQSGRGDRTGSGTGLTYWPRSTESRYVAGRPLNASGQGIEPRRVGARLRPPDDPHAQVTMRSERPPGSHHHSERGDGDAELICIIAQLDLR